MEHAGTDYHPAGYRNCSRHAGTSDQRKIIMLDLLQHLALGFSVAFTPENLAYALLGCILGTLIGVLPGIGPVPTIAMLLPLTYILPPTAGLIMLAGIYYGAQYGGSTTAI